MVDLNKAIVLWTNESTGDENSLSQNEKKASWDKYIALLEDKLQKAALRDEYEAYHLYCEYAHAMGFSVRKGKHEYFPGTMKMRSKLFTCSKEGVKDQRVDKEGNVLHTSSKERTGCQARIWFTRRIDGLFKVSKWIKEHNHKMADLNQRHLLRSARSTGLIHGNLMESHVNSEGCPVDPYNMVVGDSMQHEGVSQSQLYFSTESEMMWCNRMMRKMHDLIMRSKGNVEARRIVEKALEDAHEKVNAILQNEQMQSSEDAIHVNGDKDDQSDGPMLDPLSVKSKCVSRTRVQSHWKRERYKKIAKKAAERARNRKKWRKSLASQDTYVVQHIGSSIPSVV